MPEHSFDRGTALLVIDVQQGLFERANPIYEARQVLDNINTLIRDARIAGVPVIFIQHANENTLVRGSDAWQLHPEIQPLEGEPLIHKRHGNAFIDTELQEVLREKGVESLLVTGLVTHGCVRATSLGALDLGYRVALVRDGHSNFSKGSAQLITKWNQTLHEKGAELVDTAEVAFAKSGKGVIE
jgi:nicotinamidase-related amidase